MTNYNDPFDALFALQRALDARHDSDWMGESTAGIGSYPPLNIFQKGDDFLVTFQLLDLRNNVGAHFLAELQFGYFSVGIGFAQSFDG